MDHTKKLLEECNSGCKMAVNSMKQIDGFVQDDGLEKVIDKYKEKHEQLERKTSALLLECGAEEKEPGTMAAAFSWLTTEMKLIIKDDSNQIAKLLMDGCNMGIKSIGEACNKYDDASQKASSAAKDLIRMEEDFMKDLQCYL